MLTSWKYTHRVRCSRFPAVVARFRNWPDAPASNAWDRTGYRCRIGEGSGEIAVANDRADPNRTICQLDDLVQRQVADVDDQVGRSYPQLHAVDQIGAAGQIHRIRLLGHRGHRAGDVLGA